MPEKRSISIDRALREAKLLETRLDRLIQEIVPIATAHPTDKVIAGITLEVFETKAVSKNDAIKQLFKNYTELKEAIAVANATNKITVNGIEYTVAAAIERKTSIQREEKYLDKLRSMLTQAKQIVSLSDMQVKSSAEQKAGEVYGKKEGQVDNDQYDKFVKDYRTRNTITLVDPLGLEKLVEDLTLDIERFKTQVNYTLTESNVKNMIEVSAEVA